MTGLFISYKGHKEDIIIGDEKIDTCLKSEKGHKGHKGQRFWHKTFICRSNITK